MMTSYFLQPGSLCPANKTPPLRLPPSQFEVSLSKTPLRPSEGGTLSLEREVGGTHTPALASGRAAELLHFSSLSVSSSLGCESNIIVLPGRTDGSLPSHGERGILWDRGGASGTPDNGPPRSPAQGSSCSWGIISFSSPAAQTPYQATEYGRSCVIIGGEERSRVFFPSLSIAYTPGIPG